MKFSMKPLSKTEHTKNLIRLRKMATNAASSTITSVSGTKKKKQKKLKAVGKTVAMAATSTSSNAAGTEAQISDNGGKCVKPPFKIKIEVKEGSSVTFAMEQFGQLQTVSLTHGNGECTFTQTQVPWTHEKSELPFSHTQVKSEKPDTEIVGAGKADVDAEVVSATMLIAPPLKTPVSLPLKKPVPLPLNAPVPLPLKKPVSLPLNKPVSLPLNKPVSWPRKKRVYDRYCEICQVDYNSKIMEESHLKGKRHKKEMSQLEINAQGTISSSTSQVNKVKKHKQSQCKGPKPAKKKLHTSKQLAEQQVI